MTLLRVRTEYSFRAATGHLNEVVRRLKEIKADCLPITDRASTFGFARWGKAAKVVGLKPVYGVELAVTKELQDRRPIVDYWTFVSIDSIDPINKLIAVATSQFKYQPLLTLDQALAATETLNVIMGHKPPMEALICRANLYLGLGPGVSKGLLSEARKAGVQLAATSNNVFTREEDKNFYQCLVGRNASLQTYPQHILSPDEWRQWAADLGQTKAVLIAAEKNSRHILEQSNADLPRAALPSPPRPGTLEEMCKAGAKRLGCNLKRPEYAARLKRELSIIKEKGFENYFYIVADLVQWARKQMMVGPARGSSCGSLACYLLGITTVDPIPYGLIFERFIDLNRKDMPDIDIDFSDQCRDEVFKYLRQTYGAANVARVGTVSLYKPRSALHEVSGALGLPEWMCDAVADALPFRSSGDERALMVLEDTFANTTPGKELIRQYPEAAIATRFEGHARHYSQHAAGVVLAAEPISHYVATDNRTGAIMCDKYDAEGAYNLLKIDALGLTQLSIFEDALELAGLPHDHLDTIDLNDPLTFKVLNSGKFAGIFQFNGRAIQNLSKGVKFENINDIVAITALGRPGPLNSGAAAHWVARKAGKEPIAYAHELIKPYVQETLGMIVYQEQVMEIARQIGGFTWEEVTALRRVIGKSVGREAFDKFGDPWKAAAIAKGMPKEVAERYWQELCTFGAYGFNKSHSVAYGLISYWCAWLKAHHPLEFAAASLSHEKSPVLKVKLLRELVAEGFEYLPFHRTQSENKWIVGHKEAGLPVLIGPLSGVYGIGPKLQAEILACRKMGKPVPARAEKIFRAPRTDVDTLWPVRDAVQLLLPDPRSRNIVSEITPPSKIEPKPIDQDVVTIGVFEKIAEKDENEESRVSRRGFEITDGFDKYLNFWVADDEGSVFCRITRKLFPSIGKEIVERGRAGKAVYAVKGWIRASDGDGGGDGFVMLYVNAVRYLGDLDDLHDAKEKIEAA